MSSPRFMLLLQLRSSYRGDDSFGASEKNTWVSEFVLTNQGTRTRLLHGSNLYNFPIAYFYYFPQ